jgi:hypothetical protein
MVQPEYVNNLLNQAGVPSLASAVISGGVAFTTATQLKDFSTQYEVGSARNFSRDQSREVHKRYSLGVNSQQPFQIVPLKIDTKLIIEKVILYKNDILKLLFGFWGESLAQQQMPMMLIEFKASPSGNLLEQAIIMYLDCWFVDNPIEYDVQAEDLLVIQDVKIECGRVIVYDPSASGIVSAANTLISIGKDINLF